MSENRGSYAVNLMKNMKFEYKNHNNKIKTYEIFPLEIKFGTIIEESIEPEWFLKAIDIRTQKKCFFILKNIRRIFDDNIQRFLCVSVYVKNSQNKFLMIYSQKFNCWIPPGGKVEPHETPDETAVRKFFEKTVISIEHIGKKASVEGGLVRPYGNQLNKITPTKEYVDLIYLAQPIKENTSSHFESEFNNIEWFSIHEITKIKTFPSILFWSQYFCSISKEKSLSN
jgi:8-oxo-dGTP pyrophosphatase MutT (NUDIX family)